MKISKNEARNIHNLVRKNLLQIAPDEEVRIVDFDYKYNQIPVLSNDDVYQLLEMYPELILPEAKNSMPKRNKQFLNLFSLLKKERIVNIS